MNATYTVMMCSPWIIAWSLRLPFLDLKLIDYALKIPGKYKIKEGVTKYILRVIALEKGIPQGSAFRKKTVLHSTAPNLIMRWEN